MEGGYLGEAQRHFISMCFTPFFHSNTSEIEVYLVLYPPKEKAGLNFHLNYFFECREIVSAKETNLQLGLPLRNAWHWGHRL